MPLDQALGEIGPRWGQFGFLGTVPNSRQRRLHEGNLGNCRKSYPSRRPMGVYGNGAIGESMRTALIALLTVAIASCTRSPSGQEEDGSQPSSARSTATHQTLSESKTLPQTNYRVDLALRCGDPSRGECRLSMTNVGSARFPVQDTFQPVLGALNLVVDGEAIKTIDPLVNPIVLYEISWLKSGETAEIDIPIDVAATLGPGKHVIRAIYEPDKLRDFWALRDPPSEGGSFPAALAGKEFFSNTQVVEVTAVD